MLRMLVVSSWTCLAAGIAVDFAAARSFPYGATVKTNDAAVRSGPGAGFYATDRLNHGVRVEVYRHDGAWAAIRPPDGSFSWFPVRAVELTDVEPLGHVTISNIKTRIGSRYGDDHHVEYVPLRQGEIVEILGESHLQGSSERWYKILPCAGEFRWMRVSSLDPIAGQVHDAERIGDVQLAQSLESDPVSDGTERLESSGGVWKLDETPLELEHRPNLIDVAATPHADNDPPSNERSSTLSESAASMSPGAVDLEHPESMRGMPPPLWDASQRRRHTTNPDLLRQELSSINVELSRMVIREPSLWRLGEFRARCQAVIDLSSTNDMRSQAQEVLARIAQFEDLQRRHESLTQRAAQDTFGTDAILANPLFRDLTLEGRYPSSLPPTLSGVLPSSASYYDGVGWLMPVVTRRHGVPRYALTDQNGNILQFVSPKPGLNLRNYERKRIGVMGQKGYMPEFSKAHLTAERIITLDRVRY